MLTLVQQLDATFTVLESYKGYECPRDYFRCNSTYECLPSNKLCDGELDCSDGSDERVCGKFDAKAPEIFS